MNHRSHTFAHLASFGTDNTCGNSVVQSEGVTNGEHPFANLDVVRVSYHDGRQVFGVNLDKCQIGRLVSTDDASRILLRVLVQRNGQFVGTVHHVVVGNDISVGRNNHTRTCCCTLWSLHLTLASTVVAALSASEEASEGVREEILEWVAVLNGLSL